MAQVVHARTHGHDENDRYPEVATRTLHILVIGATRHTGNLVMQQALAAGHTVTALARDPARIGIRHDRLRVMRGDVLDPATLASALAGCDAVVSALGATSKVRAHTTLYSQGMRNIIEAMRENDVHRLIAITAAPLCRDKSDTLPSKLITTLLWTFIKELYADMARMEDVLRASDLDWTIVRPPKLTSKPATGKYRTAINRSVHGGYSISRADQAGAILALLDDPASIGAAFGIAY